MSAFRQQLKHTLFQMLFPDIITWYDISSTETPIAVPAVTSLQATLKLLTEQGRETDSQRDRTHYKPHCELHKSDRFKGQNTNINRLADNPNHRPPTTLPFIRQLLSYDDCLEDKREDYQNSFFAVLCNITVHNHKHADMNMSQINSFLRLAFLVVLLCFYYGQLIYPRVI